MDELNLPKQKLEKFVLEKNGEKRLDVYQDYSDRCKEKYFQELWYGYSWKNVIVE